MTALYDIIGDDYNQTRKPDPYLASRLMYHLEPRTALDYVDVGCGTGNYTSYLYAQGVKLTGVDSSQHMLQVARQKFPNMKWVEASVKCLPFGDGNFVGGVATLTIHHWPDLALSFKEVARVIDGGPLVIFTSLPTQMKGYWLNHYFPKMMQGAIQQMPSRLHLETAFETAGWKIITEEKYFVKPDLRDMFLYSGKYTPQFYLDPNRRVGISSFRKLCSKEELRAGLSKLTTDIETNDFQKIQTRYHNDVGDYLFIKLECKK